MEQILNDLAGLVVPLAKDLVAAILVFLIGFKVINFFVKKIKNGKILKNMDPSVAGFIASFASVSLKILVIVSVIAILGVPMSSIVALVASAGVAVGLAVQGALSNLVGGLMILLFRPFRVGDYVEAQSVAGTVREISVFYTVLLTPDNKVITVPNGGLTNSVITNYSAEECRRVDISISASYDNSIESVKETLLKVAASCDKVINEPAAPAAVALNCGENGVNYALRVWCKGADYWDVYFELTEGVRNSFKNCDIEIPYHQMKVHIKKDQ